MSQQHLRGQGWCFPLSPASSSSPRPHPSPPVLPPLSEEFSAPLGAARRLPFRGPLSGIISSPKQGGPAQASCYTQTPTAQLGGPGSIPDPRPHETGAGGQWPTDAGQKQKGWGPRRQPERTLWHGGPPHCAMATATLTRELTRRRPRPSPLSGPRHTVPSPGAAASGPPAPLPRFPGDRSRHLQRRD